MRKLLAAMASPSQYPLAPLAGMRPDTRPYLRTVVCLPNPGDSGARWRGLG